VHGKGRIHRASTRNHILQTWTHKSEAEIDGTGSPLLNVGSAYNGTFIIGEQRE